MTSARPTHEPEGRASSPLRADDCNHDFLQRKPRRARSDAPYLGQPVHGTDARPTLEVEATHEPENAWTANQQLMRFEVHGPNACAKRMEAFHEPLVTEHRALPCALSSHAAVQLCFRSLWALLALFLFAGCRTAAPLPPVNPREPGWNVQQGQAVWRSRRSAPEIAGELMVAMHPDGRSLVQFTKTPLPFVVAQATIDSWQIQFVTQNKVYSGRGQPPAQLIWLHLPQCLRGGRLPVNLSWVRLENQGWRLENRSTGESLEGYLAP